MYIATLMLLGSGELGREFAIAAKRLGCRIIACDRYENAPAMQLADAFEVFPMLDGKALRAAVEKHKPDVIVPEIEAIDTATLAALEGEGWRVAPSAKAVQLTMNRDGIRDFAANEIGLVTSKYRFAESREEAVAAADEVGLPCVVKPVMSSSGKGQSAAKKAEEVGPAWDYAVANMRGDRPRVIVEEYIAFDSEITLLTVATRDGVLFCAPVGHRQEKGDYRESWQPAAIPREALHSARYQARKIVEALGGHGIFGVEFFVRGDQAIFSELSPRPHDTGMVTLISQFPNEFELHLRAILGLPIPSIELIGPSASAVILADRESEAFSYSGTTEALALGAPGYPVDLRIFAKPKTLNNRRMGVALARGPSVEDALGRAKAAAARVRIDYQG
ncbi:MAG: formate-dependent phosphoribosylglycinamide formyltransferase [Sphingomonas sp.]|nr:formate-dependent phosphoribosylglycinamide formyltransferase [Sphingomonas sp.]